MRFCILFLLVATFFIVECRHTFLGTNVGRPLVHHYQVQYNEYAFRKRVENLYYALPATPMMPGRVIQVFTLFKVKYVFDEELDGAVV